MSAMVTTWYTWYGHAAMIGNPSNEYINPLREG